MKSFIRVMKALSDPNRVKIMKLLAEKELCVCELTELLGVAQSTVSKHLKILEDAGFVASWRDGAWVNYGPAKDPGNPYAAAIQKRLGEWLNDDPQVRDVLSRVHAAERQRICAS